MQDERSARTFLAPWIVLVTLAVAGCSSGGRGGGAATTAGTTLRAKIVTDVVIPLDDATRQAFDAGVMGELQTRGFTIESDRVIAPAVPAVGRWVTAGTRAFTVDPTGLVTLDELPAGVTELAVHRQLDDAQPETTFPASTLVASPGEPGVVTLRTFYRGPTGMSDPSEAPQALRATAPPAEAGTGCPLTTFDGCTDCKQTPCDSGNANVKCCLDWDGTLPGHCEVQLHLVLDRCNGLNPNCTIERLRQFYGSTCWNFVAGGARRPCSNEGAAAIFSLPGGPTSPPSPITCFQNHKGRNCQSVRETDLKAGWSSADGPKEITLAPGGSATFHIYNNTWSNHSTWRFIPGGGGTPTEERVKHFDDSDAANPVFKYDVNFPYTAPADLQGKEELRERIIVSADGILVELVAIVKKQPDPPQEDPCDQETQKGLRATFSSSSANTRGGSFSSTDVREFPHSEGVTIQCFGDGLDNTTFNLAGKANGQYTLVSDGAYELIYFEKLSDFEHREWKAASGTLVFSTNKNGRKCVKVTNADMQPRTGGSSTGSFRLELIGLLD